MIWTTLYERLYICILMKRTLGEKNQKIYIFLHENSVLSLSLTLTLCLLSSVWNKINNNKTCSTFWVFFFVYPMPSDLLGFCLFDVLLLLLLLLQYIIILFCSPTWKKNAKIEDWDSSRQTARQRSKKR